MDSNPIALVLLAGFVGFVLWNTGPVQTVNGQNVVPTKTNYDWWRSEGEADASFDVYSDSDVFLASFNIVDNRLYQSPEQEQAGRIKIKATHNFFGGDPGFDLGALAAYHKGMESDRFQVGVRYSPLRLGFNAIATDFVITEDTAGVGLSFYLPSKGKWYSKFGLGAWYLAPFAHGDPAFAYGLSFSTK